MSARRCADKNLAAAFAGEHVKTARFVVLGKTADKSENKRRCRYYARAAWSASYIYRRTAYSRSNEMGLVGEALTRPTPAIDPAMRAGNAENFAAPGIDCFPVLVTL